ncbi:23S rRNA pseudouridine2605 synthase [Clostridium sp. USBA 49]|jgi:23S rRNA pseudouridine2605 synthase|uniref:pseudouridine synthase n=1 Tax=Clostridium TaxID=1485 RepID=UPI000999489A|nr:MULTISPECIES: pseudouridine synthase [Clostridium]SKA76681.1 23S rRNA pseudouridine2605 synthase [Clostridium sp. USBA 49]
MLERLQKYMAECGIASRRKCEEIIISGRVKVNDKIITQLGYKIDRKKDIIAIDGKIIKPEQKKIYIALNKPTGYLSTVKDDRGRKTILDLVKTKERIYPIGRLDYDTSGLILLTNDGEIYNKIIHPRQIIKKTYIAKLKGIPTNLEINKFKNGIDIGGYITATADFRLINILGENCEVEIKIHEGKNRQIRRMCEKINHQVISLKRISIGEIKLGNLELGKFRNLTQEEIQYLKTL